MIAKHLQSQKAFVYTLTIPEYYQSQRQTVQTLLKSVCYALKKDQSEILEHVSEDHLETLNSATNDIDLDLWMEYVSHIAGRVFDTQLVFIDAHTFEFNSLVFREMSVFLLHVKNVFNPIRIDKHYKTPSYNFKLMAQMETHIKSQQQHHPENVKKVMEGLGAKDIVQLATM